MTTPSDDRSPLAKAYGWSARIMVVSLEMVLPGLAGYWLDKQLGSVGIFLLLGLVVGSIGGMWHLMRMIAVENRRGARQTEKTNKHSGE